MRHSARARAWEPRDYVQERRFCPLEDIQNASNDYLRNSGATEVVTISLDQLVTLRKLTFVSHAETADGELLSGLLSRFERRKNPFTPNPLWQPITTRSLDRALQDAASPMLYDGISGNTFISELQRLHRTSPWTVVGEFHPRSEFTINCLVLRRGGIRYDDDSFVQAITERVNGTASASVYRDRSVTLQVERALDEISDATPARPGDRFLPLVRMARRVTQSSAAAIFFYDGANETEQLVAASQNAASGFTLRKKILSEHDWREGGELAGWSFLRRRPELLPENRPRNTAPISTWLFNGASVAVELAVPIPSAPGGGSTPNAGVIVLCRGSSKLDQSSAYGNYELALLRNVALRIALLRTSLMMDDAGWAIAQTARAFAVAEQGPSPVLNWKNSSIWSGSRQQAASRADEPWVPQDLKLSVPLAVPIVEFAGRLTGSDSVTFRVLKLGDFGSGNDDEHHLVRVVSWPDWKLHERQRELPLSSPSVHSWVAKSGRPCYLPDVDLEENYRRYPGLAIGLRIPGRATRSELCVPIFVDQRIIGTMNFESRATNAFALLRSVAEGCAAQVALAIAAVRRQYLREVLSIGSDVQSSAHDLAGLVSEMRNAVHENGADQSELVQAIHTLDEVIDVLAAEEPKTSTKETNLSIPLQRAVMDAGIVTSHSAQLDLQVRWAPRFARRFYLAMLEIFRNVNRYGSLDWSGIPRITGRLSELGGREYAEVLVIHGLRPPMRSQVSQLYRVPISAGDRMHFGAYTAGAIIRSLGGDVLARHTDGHRLLTVIAVPTGRPKS